MVNEPNNNYSRIGSHNSKLAKHKPNMQQCHAMLVTIVTFTGFLVVHACMAAAQAQNMIVVG